MKEGACAIRGTLASCATSPLPVPPTATSKVFVKRVSAGATQDTLVRTVVLLRVPISALGMVFAGTMASVCVDRCGLETTAPRRVALLTAVNVAPV